ncbi:MAG: nucleoside-diphosphate kinase [Calditrichia bacterium]|nr:nucleoside-diphosphate kinase [Calditrichota bacterium]MCB0270723.1 nucleoside-diphosphate kinase [Calditrichota bacterium]MCB0285798.1 nucleoside-diphosphate kinase [Calditrichota bacterium]MCB9068647.1 nucleoside-diphosphate kinase [Calditrichia bacterium]
MERTYTMIKPECVGAKHIGDVIARIEKGGYRILGLKMLHLSKTDAGKFYEIHKERPFYGELVDFMSSGPIVAMVLEKENCIADYRKFIGATNPAEAAAGTIRKDFGTNIQNNCVHASDSPENAVIEIKFFFSERELVG